MEKVEGELDLVQKFIPQLYGAVLVNSGQPHDEMILEYGNSTFSCIDLVVVGRDKVNVHLVGLDVYERPKE